MATKLLLIRHGQIRANKAGRWHGATDSPLTATGRRQAQRMARRLHRELPRLDAVYASPLRRSFDTARPLAEQFALSVIADDDLREYGLGELEDTPFIVLRRELDFFNRIAEDMDFAPLGGESVNGVATRTVPALNRMARAHGDAAHVAVVSHAVALAVAVAALIDNDARRWPKYQMANCSITELVLEPKPLLLAFNQSEHL